MPNYIAGNGITIENNIISSKTTSTSEIGSFKVDGSTIYIDNNNVIHGKKEQTITLSDYVLEIGAESTTVTVLSHKGDGALSVSSSDTSVATASISGDTITIIGVDSGDATIIVTASATSTYQEATATISVTVQAVQIYGVQWDGSSSPAWTRTDDAVGFADPNPYYSGMTGTPSSPFDDIMPWSGMRIVEDSTAGTLVEIPKFYYKWTRNGTAMKLQISPDEQTDEGWHVSPAHADRDDGVGERDYVYIGRYKCNNIFTKSQSGYEPSKDYISAMRSNIHNLGSNIQQHDFAMQQTIRMLYLVEFANQDSQSTIGQGGFEDAVQTVINMGYTDSISYHTGTIKSDKTTSGPGIQYRYIEGLQDNGTDQIDGIKCVYVYTSSGQEYQIRSQLNPSNYENDYSSIGQSIYIGSYCNTNYFISKFTDPISFEDFTPGFEYALLPLETNNNYGYICDAYYKGGSGEYVCYCCGGQGPNSNYNGLFSLKLCLFNETRTSRLMVLPPSRLTSTT